jgi:L-ascorbate metabolism protein UlaG (beta-lactamase superfamily)
LGHATWLVESDQYRLVIDPFLTDNPLASFPADDIQVQFVLITHGHFDHVADAASIANRCHATLVASYEIASWFAEKHAVKNTLGMNIGGWTDMPFGRLKMTQAIHSSQLPDGSYGGLAAGYIIETGGKRIYFAGDTALFSDMQLIGQTKLNAAILPIGDLFTMGPEDALQAAKWLKADLVMPSHYGTWPPIQQDAATWAQRVGSCCDCRGLVPVTNKPISI